MKFFSTIAVILLLICGGALWFLASGSLNDFVKVQIENEGKKITGETVTVSKVDIKLTEGAGSIYDISLANPDAYNYPTAFSLSEATLDINVKSLSSDPIVIDAIVIKNPQAFAEVTKNGQSNIKDLIDTIEKNLSLVSKTDNKKRSETDKMNEPNIRVEKIVLEGTSLSLDLSALGNKEHVMTLPDVTLNTVGGDSGLPASQLGGVIVKQALSAIWKQTKKAQKQKLKKQATDKIKEKAKKKLSELFNKL